MQLLFSFPDIQTTRVQFDENGWMTTLPFRFLRFSLLTLFQVLQAQWPLTPSVNTNAVHKWMYINERKSICKMHIGYIILCVLMFNVQKVRISFLGPCTQNCFNDAATQNARCYLKWSARTDYSTNEIKTSCFYYLFIFCANKWTTFCKLGPKHMR